MWKSYHSALSLNIPLTNEIAGKYKWRLRVPEIILTLSSQKHFSGKLFVYLGTMKNGFVYFLNAIWETFLQMYH